HNFLGGEIQLDPSLARKAIQHLAEQLNMSLHQTAAGILRISEAKSLAPFARSRSSAGSILKISLSWPLAAVVVLSQRGLPGNWEPRELSCPQDLLISLPWVC